MNNDKKRILDIFSTDIKSNNGFHLPYIIAEAGVNHDGKIDLAKRLIDEAREGGADAIKFQTYRAHTLASANSPAYWDTSKEPIDNQFKLFQKYDNFWKSEFEILKYYCDEVGIEFMSTPFDNESATFLNDLMSTFKISSSDITNKPFIEFIANKCREVGAKVLDLNVSAPFHCSLMHPASMIMNKELENIKFFDLKTKFINNVEASFSKEKEKIKNLLVKQVTNRVRWRETIELISKNGINNIVEVGSGKVLSGLNKRMNLSIESENIEKLEDIDSFLTKYF